MLIIFFDQNKKLFAMALRNYYNKTHLKKKKKDDLVDLCLDLQAQLLDRIIDGDEAKAYQEKITQLKEQNKKLKEENKENEETIAQQDELLDELTEDLDEQDDIKTQIAELRREVKMWENAVDV